MLTRRAPPVHDRPHPAMPPRCPDYFKRATAAVLAALACFLLAATAAAQTDDEDPPEPADRIPRFELSESTFESYVFGHDHTAFDVRAEQEKLLELSIDDAGRAGKLTDGERKKLQRAGRGDIKRFFQDVDAMRKKLVELVGKDARRFGEFLQESRRPLQRKLDTGLFNEGSLFRKTLHTTLSVEALSRYHDNQRQRQALRHQAQVEWVVAMLDSAMSLRDDQRQDIIRLMLERTRSPRRSSDMDHYVIMWQLSRLPEDLLRPLFDDRQWKVLQKEFEQMRDIERHLRRQGYLTFDDEDAAVKNKQADSSNTTK